MGADPGAEATASAGQIEYQAAAALAGQQAVEQAELARGAPAFQHLVLVGAIIELGFGNLLVGPLVLGAVVARVGAGFPAFDGTLPGQHGHAVMNGVDGSATFASHPGRIER